MINNLSFKKVKKLKISEKEDFWEIEDFEVPKNKKRLKNNPSRKSKRWEYYLVPKKQSHESQNMKIFLKVPGNNNIQNI